MSSKVNSQLSGKLSYTEWSSLYRFGSVLVFPAPFQLSLNTGPRKCHRTRQSCRLIWGPGTYQEQVPWASVFPCYFHECPFLQKLLWGEKQISLVRLMPSTLLEEVVRRPLSGRLKLWCFPEDQRAAHWGSFQLTRDALYPVYVTAALETGISAFLECFASKYAKPQTLFWPQSGPNNDSPSGLLPQESIQNGASKGLLKQLKTCE